MSDVRTTAEGPTGAGAAILGQQAVPPHPALLYLQASLIITLILNPLKPTVLIMESGTGPQR